MKLYWRIKKDGKWTWKAATDSDVTYAALAISQGEDE